MDKEKKYVISVIFAAVALIVIMLITSIIDIIDIVMVKKDIEDKRNQVIESTQNITNDSREE